MVHSSWKTHCGASSLARVAVKPFSEQIKLDRAATMKLRQDLSREAACLTFARCEWAGDKKVPFQTDETASEEFPSHIGAIGRHATALASLHCQLSAMRATDGSAFCGQIACQSQIAPEPLSECSWWSGVRCRSQHIQIV